MGGLIDRGKREMAQKKKDLKKIEHRTQPNTQRPQSTIIVTRELFEGTRELRSLVFVSPGLVEIFDKFGKSRKLTHFL